MLHEKNVTEFKTLKIAFGLSFFNLCVGRLLVQTTRFVVKYLQKPLTCKAETCSTVHKVPSLQVKISIITFIQLIYVFFNIIYFAQASIIFMSNFIKKIKCLVIKILKKVLEFFSILIMVGKRAL